MTETPIWNNGSDQIERWKSPLQKLRGESVVKVNLRKFLILQTYNLTVMVSDGLFQNTASVLIDVTDVNDNAPEFDKEVYEITDVVEETIPPPDGQFLVQVIIHIVFCFFLCLPPTIFNGGGRGVGKSRAGVT